MLTPKSVLTSVSNNRTFSNPVFSTASGTTSDGLIYTWGIQTGFWLTKDNLEFMRKNSTAKNVAIAGGGAYAKFNIRVNGTEYPLQIDNSWSHSDSTCVFCSLNWLWNITQQGTHAIEIVQYITGGNGDNNNRNFAGFALQMAPTNSNNPAKNENPTVMKYFNKSIATFDNSFQWRSCVGWR